MKSKEQMLRQFVFRALPVHVSVNRHSIEMWEQKMLRQSQIARQRMNIQHGGIPVNYLPRVRAPLFYLRQNCTTPPFNRNFGIFLGWHVIIWDGSQVKAIPNPSHPPLAIILTYQAFCTGMKILHFILLRCVKLESEIFLII